MKNVLQVIGHLGCGGDTTVVLDIMNNMDKDKYHFDFLTHEGTTKIDVVEMLRKNGSNVYILPGDVRKMGIFSYYNAVKKLLKNNQIRYDAIHVHTGMQSGVSLLAAKNAGISNRICHSHVTAIQRKTFAIKKIIAAPFFRMLLKNSTCNIACSRMAGDFLFEKEKYEVIYNAVNIDDYISVTKEELNEVRSSLGINDDILIGHVGRMSPMKNQRFILELAKSMKKNTKFKFVLVGDGIEFEEIKSLASGIGNVILTGQRQDISVLMKLFDCVILPSLPGEGFPVTMLEAQAAGCPCIISDKVTPEVEVGLNLVQIIPTDNMQKWVNAIENVRKIENMELRNSRAVALEEKGVGKTEFIKKWLSNY